jgi:uncharacterized membrane protein (DUF373 family)
MGKTEAPEGERPGRAVATKDAGAAAGPVRTTISRTFSRFEDVVYVGLGLLLAYSAAALLVTGAGALWSSILAGAPVQAIIELLDRSLLILMVVELLYTVQVSFQAHALVPEPFLVVGLIAATRRILVVTAQFAHLVEPGSEVQFRNAMMEVALLTVMVLALVGSLRLLRNRAGLPPREPR